MILRKSGLNPSTHNTSSGLLSGGLLAKFFPLVLAIKIGAIILALLAFAVCVDVPQKTPLYVSLPTPLTAPTLFLPPSQSIDLLILLATAQNYCFHTRRRVSTLPE